MKIDGFYLAVAKHRGHGAPVNKFHAFFEHVAQILGNARHLPRVTFDGNHGDFDSTLAQSFARTVYGGVSPADDHDAGAKLDLGSAHADVAEEGKSVDHPGRVFTFSAYAVGFGKADGQDASVIVLFQVVPGNVLSDFAVGFYGDAKFAETFDLAIENVLRKNPVGNAAAV